jgi:DUF4097 and DUF4098 domain-containing protein YvlB
MVQSTVRFPVADAGAAATRVAVTSRSGRVEVFAEERTDIQVEGARDAELRSDDRGDHVHVEATHQHVVVRCPPGTDLSVGTMSGRVALTGDLGEVRVTTGSGRIEVGGSTSVDVRTRSGNIRVGRSRGVVRARSTSGRVVVEAATQLDATTASGGIAVGSVHDANVRSTSGTIEVALELGGSVAARTVSGRVEISLAAGAQPDLRLRSVSGRITAPDDPGSDRVGSLAVDTVSGRIRIGVR